MDNKQDWRIRKMAERFVRASELTGDASDATLRAYAEGSLDPLTRDLLAMRLAEDEALFERYLESVDLDQPVAGEEESVELFRAASGERAAFDAYRRTLPDDNARERAERLYTELHESEKVAAGTKGEERVRKDSSWSGWLGGFKPQARPALAFAACLVLAAVLFFQFHERSENRLVAVRAGDEQLQKETFERILSGRTELGPNDAIGLDKLPLLAFPPPENPGVLAMPDRFDFVLPDLGRDGEYEAGCWELQNGKPRRRIRADSRIEGNRLLLTPREKMVSGTRYLVGTRLKVGDVAAADADRPWRTFRQWLLTEAQAAERKRAQALVEREPGIATAILVSAGRLGEASEILQNEQKTIPQGSQLLGKLGTWIESEKHGSFLKIDPTLPTEALRAKEDSGVLQKSRTLDASLARPGEDSEEEIIRLWTEGWSERGQKDLPKASDAFRSSYEMAKRLRRDWEVVKCGYMLTLVYVEQDQILASEPYIDPVLFRIRKMYSNRYQNPKRRSDIEQIYSQTCFRAGMIARTRGVYQKALAMQIESEQITRECGLSNQLPSVLYEKGRVQQEMGNLASAVRTYEENLDVLGKVPEGSLERDSVWIDQYAKATTNLAACLTQLGESKRAKRLCDAALKWKGQLSQQSQADLPNVRALARMQLGEDRGALADASEAIKIFRKLPNPDGAKGESIVETTLGILYLKKGMPDEAVSRFHHARDLAESIGMAELVREADINLQVARLVKDPERLEATMPDRRSSGEAGAVEYHIAATLEILHENFKAAEGHARRAVEIARIAKMQADLPLMLNNLAWTMSQNGRRRDSVKVFQEGILLSDATVQQARPETVGIVQQRGLGNIYARYAYTLWKLGRAHEAAAVLDAPRGLGMKAVQARRKIAKFADLTMSKRVSLLRKSIDARPGSLVLQYATIDDDRTLLLVSSARQPTQGFDLRLGALGLARGMDAWNPSSAPDALGSETTESGERAAARKMGVGLLGAVERAGLLDPKRVSHVVIAGDAAVHEVPFAALIDIHGKRLVERFAVSYAAYVNDLDRRWSAGPTKALSCMSYTGIDKTSQASAVRDAAREVARSVPGTAVPNGSGISEQKALQDLKSNRIVLIAGHADRGRSDPLDASFQVGPNEAGRLVARDVVDVRLNNDVVMLAGCGTATGVLAGGDGLLGLAWAFQAAGSKSVVASAWRVSDQATNPLVAGFFRYLLHGVTNDEALRRAEVEVMRSPARWHPYYWAGFKLIGERLKVRL